MNYLKILSMALIIGLTFWACNTQECYECTASDINGIGTDMVDEICQKNEVSDSEALIFKTQFESLHDPVSYEIECIRYKK